MTELIVALDVETLREEQDLVDKLHGTVTFFKVGLQLFTGHGRRAVDIVLKKGGRVFLDLKLHDIPQTVASALRETQKMGVEAVSVHLSGGAGMLRAARELTARPKLWGVSILTSLGDCDTAVFHDGAKVADVVARLAKLGKQEGIDGLICSPQEVAALRPIVGKLPFITPGIRPAGAALNDQKRVMTPAEAAALGIEHIVVGRPITHAEDPLRAAQDILTSMRTTRPSSVEKA